MGRSLDIVDRILATMELAGSRAGDIAPLVYAKLFAAHPDMEALFVRDKTGAVRGEMLARTIEMILDFLETDGFASNMLACEAVTHAGYGVPPEIFPAFFTALHGSLRESLAEDWRADEERAWAELVERLQRAALASQTA